MKILVFHLHVDQIRNVKQSVTLRHVVAYQTTSDLHPIVAQNVPSILNVQVI